LTQFFRIDNGLWHGSALSIDASETVLDNSL
jgi:hypothetical protein